MALPEGIQGGLRKVAAASALAFVLLPALLAPDARAGRGTFEKQRIKKKLTDAHDPRLNAWSFVNDRREFGRLTLLANVFLGQLRLEDLYLPVGFALVNEGKGGIHVSPGNFALLLPDGTKVPASPVQEVMASPYRDRLSFDVAERRAADITSGYYAFANRRVATNFYPPPGEAAFPTQVDLYGDSYASDWVYFRNPGGLAGKVLTLVYEDPKATAPVKKIDVRFPLEFPRNKR